jgi:inosine-uridine nucleoside N-ribohydrolase
MYANPEAARDILRSPATKTLLPLDVTNQAVLTFEQFDRVLSQARPRLARFLKEVLPFSFRAHHQHLGLEGIRLHEVAAVAAVSRPALFDSRLMAVDVETRGELTRGMTVFDRRGTQRWQTNIDVLQEVNLNGLLAYVARIASGTA